jgi:hypothetical protein
MTREEASEWLRSNLIGPTNGAQARTLAERLAGPLARLFSTRKLLPPFDPNGWLPRIDNYAAETKFPNSLFIAADGRLVGTWILGNDYRVKSEYYGGYPNTYLPRVRSLFPEKKRTLHLFSGMVDTAAFPGDTVDMSLDLALRHPVGGTHYTDDAQTLKRVPLDTYDLVLADPPYSVEDAEHYQTSMVKRNKVFQSLARLSPGTHVVWLDQVLPMWRKDTFDLIGVVGIVRSTNHRFRVMSVFRRL